MVDLGVPDINVISNLEYYNSSTKYIDAHATRVATIIKKMAPSCKIIATDATGWSCSSLENLLVDNPEIDVVCMTTATPSSNGKYSSTTEYIDEIAKNHKIPISIAVGNDNGYVCQQSLSPNVISVGAVKHSGTNPAADGDFTLSSISDYIEYPGDYGSEAISMINKPDVCAPGDVRSDTAKGFTSYSTPFVTGTIVQMMSRNAVYSARYHGGGALSKSTLMASCFYNAGMKEKIYGTLSCNMEGAGVINAGECYAIADNYSCVNLYISSLSTTEKGIYVPDTNSPMRIALTWGTENIDDSTFANTEVSLYVYKESVTHPIARSYARSYINFVLPDSDQTGPVTNYECVQLSSELLKSNGTGNYIVKIITHSTQLEEISEDVPFKCSLSWT